jgi:hypothetical protein
MSLCKSERDWRKDPHLFLKEFRKSSDFDEMKSRHGNVCNICGKNQKKKELSIDHDHQTGKIRGLLCTACNVALGHLDNTSWFEKAMLYKQQGEHSTLDLSNYHPLTSEQFRERMSKVAKEVQNRPDVKSKRDAAQRKAFDNPEVLLRMSEAQRKAWKDPETRKNRIEGKLK